MDRIATTGLKSGVLLQLYAALKRRSSTLRLQDLPGLGMDLLALDLAGIPTAAEGFYQVYGADHLLAEQLGLQALAGEQRGLRRDHVEVGGDAPDVAVVGDGQVAASVFDRRSLRGKRLRERAEIADAILNLLEGR